MKPSIPSVLAFAAGLFAATTALAAEPRTEHTFRLAEGESPPEATIETAAWLAGEWAGTAFGKRFEEAWSRPSAGTMVGYFKLYDETGVAFYELLNLVVEEGTLHLKVKHFSADFESWEEKSDYVDFKLVKVEDGALHFSGISFYRRGPDTIDAWIVMRNGDEVTEHELKYERRAPTAPVASTESPAQTLEDGR